MGPTDPTQAARSQTERWAAYVEATRLAHPPFEEDWAFYRENFVGRAPSDGPPLAWQPSRAEMERSNLAVWMRELGFQSYDELHEWSSRERGEFWARVIEWLGIAFAKEPDAVLGQPGDPRDPRWLQGAQVNIADSCLPPFKLRSKGRAAIVAGGEDSEELRVMSYSELEDLVSRIARGILARFSPGDRVALYMPFNVECVACYLAIVRAGCTVVSIADSFAPGELAKRLEIADAKGVVTVDEQRRAGKVIPMYDKVKDAGAPCTIVIRKGKAALELRPGDLLWDDIVSAGSLERSSIGVPQRVINILFSSGTTGTPKAIPWTHATPIKCAMDGHFHQDIHPEDVVAWPTNIGWMMGPWLIFASLVNGATIALYDGAASGADFTRFVEKAKVTVLGVVPSLVRAWREAGFPAHGGWPDVRVFSSTGEPSNAEDTLWLMSRTAYRAPVIEYLGGTEIGGGHITGTVVQPASPATFTTPSLGLDFVLLDEEGQPVAERESGELYLVPPSIGLSETLLNADHAKTYFENCPPGPKGEVLRRHGDKFLRLGVGFFRAQGRVDDTMNLGGIKVGSLELERVLATHDAVSACAAVGVQLGGEGVEHLVVYAVVNGKADPERLKTELSRLLAAKLNPLFKIHEMIVTPELPRTASGKLMRRSLQARYREEHTTRS